PGDDARTVRAEDARLRNRGETFANPEVEVVERGGAQLDEDVVRAGLGVGRVLVPKDLGAAVLVDSYRVHDAILSDGAFRAAAVLDRDIWCISEGREGGSSPCDSLQPRS